MADSTKPTEAVEAVQEQQPEVQQQQQETVPDSFQAQQAQMHLLHTSCSAGDVLAVRSVLSNNIELLESIDPASGLTPMLQAIYSGATSSEGKVEVVKELLMAGAYPPPPTVTSDPAILAALYPGAPVPPQQMGPPFPQPTSRRMSHGPLGERRASSDPHKLPPTEVSKTIPCRNFPNCRYGDACVFQHPQPMPHMAPHFAMMPHPPRQFYPSGPFPPEFMPVHPMAGVYGAPVPAPPAETSPVSPQTVEEGAQKEDESSQNKDEATPAVSSTSEESNSAPVDPSTVTAAPFAPAPVFQPRGMFFPGAHGLPPAFDPSAIGPHPGYAPFMPNGHSHGYPGPKKHHSKHMSFGGNAKGNWAAATPGSSTPVSSTTANSSNNGSSTPSAGGGAHALAARQAALGSWSNGQPPACVFFQNSKCRNGEMCKFPHLLPDGTDCE